MVSVTRDQRRQKSFCRRLCLRIVQTQSRKAADSRALADLAVLDGTVARFVTRGGVPAEGPLRRAGCKLRDDDLQSICSGEIHHAVVVGPVELARSHLDGAPQKPVAKGVHAHARRRLMVALPIFSRRIRLAEIHSTVGKHRSHRNFLRLLRLLRARFCAPLDALQT